MINPDVAFPGKTAGVSPDYPFGQARDVSAPGDGTGTPLRALWLNDWFGFQQAAMAAAGSTPSGAPDTATASQLFAALRHPWTGPDGNGLEDFYGGGGWTGGDAGSGSLLGSAHTNAMRWRYDVKGDPSLDPVIWVEKEIVSDANPVPGDTGWDGGAAYFDIKKTSGTSGSSTLIGHARHNGGTGGLTAVQARGSGQHIDAQVWGVWAYADIGFGAELSGVEQAIAIEANNCNRGPDKGWMPGTGAGAARGVLSITADGTNRCTHAFYVGNQRATGGTPGTGGWWTGILVSANSIAANTNGTTSYVGDGEAMRINGSGQAAYSYGGLRFYTGSFKYGISFAEGGFNNNCAILMGLGKRINWGAHPGSSRHLDYDDVNNVLSVNNMGLAMTGVKVMGPRVTGIFNLSGTADGASKNTETVTLIELARYVKKVTDALITHGMIGPT